MKKILLAITIYQTSYAIDPDIAQAPDPQVFPLHYHAYCGSNNQLENLIEAGDFHIDSSDNLGRTPLHYAALCGKIQTVYKLLELGAEQYVKDKLGKIPADLALKNGHLQINTTLTVYHAIDLARHLASTIELEE